MSLDGTKETMEDKILDRKTLEKYSSESKIEGKKLKTGFKKHKIQRKELLYKAVERASARAEMILQESFGLMEAGENSYTAHITQKQIKKAVDVTASKKGFDLHLEEFGPYKFRYSLDGRHVVGGGRKGHIFSFDWLTKHPCFELNIMESIHDVCFLQTEKWIAVAQKKWTYIYDDNGKELHCLKPLERILKLEFLPHHLLLCAGSESGFLSWLDVTIGDKAIQVPTRKGKIDVMCQNPWNAVICCGHTNGTVTMWTPNVNEPVFSILCYPQPIRSLAVDPTGRYMATGCLDRTVKIWDTRNLGHVVSSYKAGGGVDNLAFSQRQLLALSYKDVVEVYKDVTCQESCSIYMKNHCKDTVMDIQFCPYEDILGCSTQRSFSNFIIPGSGEPNFDALEANPYKTLSYRREAEVKTVLEKVPYSLITLDPKTIAQIDIPSLEEKLEAKKQLQYVRVPKVDVNPRYRMKGKSGSASRFKRKLKVKDSEKRDFLKFMREKKKEMQEKGKKKKEELTERKKEILDRFKSKRK